MNNTNTISQRITTIDSLNGIRGFAVLLVLLSHSSNRGMTIFDSLSFSGAGRYGVFLFFALSSYLLTKQFLEYNFAKGEWKAFVTKYIIRRFFRIYPLFIAALVLYLALYKFGFPIYAMDESDVLKAAFLIEGKGIFWTIPVEFQYYFIIPLVSLVLIWFQGAKIILPAAILFILSWSFVFPPEFVANLIPFLPLFLMGSMTAYISLQLKLSSKFQVASNNLIAVTSILLFIILVPNFYNILFSQDVARNYFHHQFLLFGFVSCTLILGVIHGDGFIKTLMEHRFFTFWGRISFSAYLGHMPILVFVDKIVPLPEYLQLLLFITLTAAVSFLTYSIIEVPVSKLANKLIIEKFIHSQQPAEVREGSI